jgi:hypothetical protein
LREFALRPPLEDFCNTFPRHPETGHIAAAQRAVDDMTSSFGYFLSQKSVAYQNMPKGNQQCDNCGLFQPPNACKTVDGTVSLKDVAKKQMLGIIKTVNPLGNNQSFRLRRCRCHSHQLGRRF